MRSGRKTSCSIAQAFLLALAFAVVAPGTVQAQDRKPEKIKIGLMRIASYSFIYIAQKKGYFAEQGLDAEFITFQSSGPMPAAALSGDIDFGAIGIQASFYNLAGQGALKIIAAYNMEQPGFHSSIWVASNKAYEGGLKSLKDLRGRLVGGANTGGASHYALGLAAEKYGIPMKEITFRGLQGQPNVASALVGGQVDAAIMPVGFIARQLGAGQVQKIASVSDETPFQLGISFVSTKYDATNPGLVDRFLKAYRKSAREYHNAFVAPDGAVRDGPTAPEVVGYAAEFIGRSPELARQEMAYIDADQRVDIKDIKRQVEWFKSQGLVKDNVDSDSIIDRRYVIPLPARQ
jgi:NitT/TauT family transport system substrate-binding protein